MTALPADITAAMTDADWWGAWVGRADWSRWLVFLRAVFALPMSAADLAIYQECTGRVDPLQARAKEAYANVGRRGGKTRIMATIAAWLACFEDWQQYLVPGEHARAVETLAAIRHVFAGEEAFAPMCRRGGAPFARR